jgi:hypothetical protein
MAPEWLTDLEQSLAADSSGEGLPIAVVVLASVAGIDVPLNTEEAHAACRRALLLLTAGGDPSRGLDLDGRAVVALASELERPERHTTLASGLAVLRDAATGLPHVSEAVQGLLDAPDIAWRAYACSLLAETLGED